MSGVNAVISGFKGVLMNRHKAQLLALALFLTSLVVTGFVWANKSIIIIADGKTTKTSTFFSHNDSRKVLAQAGIHLGPNDEYSVMAGKDAAAPVTIEVYRAVPVTVLYHGKTETILTGKANVRDVVRSLGIAETTKTIPEETARLAADMQIQVIDVAERIEQRDIALPRPVVHQHDASLVKGMEGVVEEGSDGLKQATMKIRYEDGVEVAGEVLSEKIIVEPKPQVVLSGTRETGTSRGITRFSRMMEMEATAYLPTDGSGHGITASGMAARQGIVAVDPRVIPLGTRLYIPGYGFALAADTGSAIKGDRIDLCMENASEAWQFGRQPVQVYILAD